MRELTTHRLLLRHYRDADAPFLFDMYRRPEVLRYLTTARLVDLLADRPLTTGQVSGGEMQRRQAVVTAGGHTV